MANWNTRRDEDNRYRDDDEFERNQRGREQSGYRSESGRSWEDDRRSGYGRGRESDRSEWSPERSSRSQFGSGRDQGPYWNDRDDRNMRYRDREMGTSRGSFYGQEAPERESGENRMFGGGSLNYGRGYGSESFGSHAPSNEGFGREGYGGQSYGSNPEQTYPSGIGQSSQNMGYGSGSYGSSQGAQGERRTWQSMQGPHRGMGPKGYKRSDDRIKEDVCERLTDHGGIDATNIEIEVAAAEVTLSGTVADRNQRRQAEDLAEQVSGVSHVQNNLRVQQQSGSSMGSSDLTASGMDPQQRSSYTS